MENRNPYAKSCIRVYNDLIQSITVDPTALVLEGDVETYSGCSLNLLPSSIQVVRPGLYHFSADADVTFGADLPSLQLYLDNDPIPSAVARIPIAAAEEPIHIETELGINPCCRNFPKITVRVKGGEAKISHLSVGALKLA